MDVQTADHVIRTGSPSRQSMARHVLESVIPSSAVDPMPIKPPLKWAGGKRWLVPHIMPYWKNHAHRRYIEPFCGGLAVSLGFQPKHAILNDMNRHVINFYEWVQRGLTLELDARNDADLYYQHRDRFNQMIRAGHDHERKAAELFYYLNRTGYNGLCRFNRKGEFNVPFGKYKTINYVHDFTPYQAAMKTWNFRAGDFQTMQLNDDDFVYADPPYDVQFVNYSQHGFSWHDQVRLAEWLAAHQGPVIISNQATERIMELYEQLGYNCLKIQAPRRISCNGNRTPATEVLAMRNID